MSVHVLGIGAMGSLLAHELVAARLSPILLVKHSTIKQNLHSLNNTMTLARHSDSGIIYNTTKMAVRQKPTLEEWDKTMAITDMIVATKTHSTKEALTPYVPYMTPDTNLIFVQNGMGAVSSAIDALWQGRQEPNVYHVISSHGAYKERVNLTHHVGMGSLTIARVPLRETFRDGSSEQSNETEPLPNVIQALLDSPNLDASLASYPEFLVAQMEKLVVNACINPITALMDCENGDLLRSTNCISMMKKVIEECVDCFRSDSEVYASVPEVHAILSKERLLQCVLDVSYKTEKNSSSMREDVRNVKLTEIDAINGYIVDLGRKNGVPTPLNQTLTTMIRAKHQIGQAKERAAIETFSTR